MKKEFDVVEIKITVMNSEWNFEATRSVEKRIQIKISKEILSHVGFGAMINDVIKKAVDEFDNIPDPENEQAKHDIEEGG